MSASSDNTAANGLRGWWADPPRSGLRLLINPWEYRHLRAFGVMRIFGGSIAGAAGLICLSYRVPKWAAFFLTIAAANLAGGSWYLNIDRSAPTQPDPGQMPARASRAVVGDRMGLTPGGGSGR
jgi:hypothetical protein